MTSLPPSLESPAQTLGHTCPRLRPRLDSASEFLVAAGTSALDDPAKMSPFFTDGGMKTLTSGKDFTAAWMAMKPDERTAVSKDCGDATLNKSHADFCAMAKKIGS